MSIPDALTEAAAPTAVATDGLPADLLVGAATSAYQVEGAVQADGRGPSIWDDFCLRPGAIVDGSDGSVACDSYHRWESDLHLVANLGFDAYRFSLAWPRIFPDSSGAPNPAGLDHYERVVDGLLQRSLQPYVTLYHWDLPLWLHRRGGWTSRDTAHAFAEYAGAVVDRLGDRVASYATLNEPWCSAFLGYGSGEHAPGVRDAAACQAAIHHLLLAHGLATLRLREGTSSPVGIVLNFTPAYPHDPRDERDVEAARRHQVFNDEVFLGPLFDGAYPDELAELAGGAASHVQDGDLSAISRPLDYLGVNYYTRSVVRHSATAGWTCAETVAQEAKHTAMGWEVYPAGLRDLLLGLARRSGLPLYVTENGAAFDEPLADRQRWAYIEAHLEAVNQARAQGADVRGYFAWSLLDNFEWAFGYTKRFGIVEVDFGSQARTPRESARRLAALLAARPQTV